VAGCGSARASAILGSARTSRICTLQGCNKLHEVQQRRNYIEGDVHAVAGVYLALQPVCTPVVVGEVVGEGAVLLLLLS
jgi:hypothetical protein